VSLFVDSSVWYASIDRSGEDNLAAKRILNSKELFVTSDHTLVETWTLLHHRFGRSVADEFWDGLRCGIAAIEMVTAADMEAAWAIGLLFPDQDFSIPDRTSFALMHRLGLTRVASFDSDFAVYRYGPGRRRAFTLVR
jgi:predicted nucleic acid-binding protein